MSTQFGDVVTVAGGTYTGKPRPVLVFQNSTKPTGESVIVIPFTTTINPDIPYRIPVEATQSNGLKKDCYLEVEKLGAIRQSWIGQKVGVLSPALLSETVTMAHRLMSP